MSKNKFAFNQEHLDDMPLIFLSLKRNGIIKYVNKFATPIIGFEVEELINKKFYEVFTPDFALEKAEEDLELIAKGVPNGTTFDNWSRTKAGSYVYIKWRIAYLEPPPLKEDSNFLVYGEEITKSFQEEILSEAKASLGAVLNRSSTIEQVLKRSIKCIADIARFEFGFAYQLSLAKEDKKCLSWYTHDLKHAKTAERLYKSDKVSGDNILKIAKQLGNETKLVLESVQEGVLGINRQLVYFFPVSKEECYCFHFFYEQKGNRSSQLFVSFFEDFEEMLFKSFERIKDKESIEEARKQAEHSNKIKDAFVASVSHEIRTPLNAILGHAQMLQREKLSKEANKSIAIINSSGSHLIKLLNEVLNVSSLESGKVKVRQKAFNLLDLIIEVQDTFSLKIAEKEIAFELNYSPSLPQIIYTDQEKVKQILINLISNALKFTKKGKVEVSVNLLDGYMVLKVKDTGAGIPKDQLGNIFKQYEKSSRHENAEGIGLGLSITKKLVELLHATIEVESQVDEGSCFTVKLPYEKPSIEEFNAFKKKDTTQLSPKIIQVKEESPHILVIDDHIDSLNVIADYLERMGFVLSLASSVKDAIKIIESEKIDLIILDIVMPEINGVSFLKDHKKDPKLRNTPIVVISGDAEPEQIDSAIKYGAASFISKPFDFDRLASLLKDLLEIELTYSGNKQDKGLSSKLIPLLEELETDIITELLQLTDGGEVSELKNMIENRVENNRLKEFLNDTIQDLNLEYLSTLLIKALKEK